MRVGLFPRFIKSRLARNRVARAIGAINEPRQAVTNGTVDVTGPATVATRRRLDEVWTGRLDLTGRGKIGSVLRSR
jgi:hypothetical protein